MKKLAYLENQKRIKVPHCEIVCPCCGNKLFVEEIVCSYAPAVYCHYCGERILASAFCVP